VNTAEAIQLGAYIVPLVGVLLAPELGRRAARKTSEATAEATMRDAFTRASEAETKKWAVFTEGLQKWCEHQADELKGMDERLGSAELGRITAEQRASQSDWRAALAANYVRVLIRWVEERWPLGDYPRPPVELNLDIAG
jgi:hypothetical protein